MTTNTTEADLRFGSFLLSPRRKVLLEGDRPVRLGSRAYDLLVALVERAGQVVSRRELEALVWPDTVVEETSLRVHVSALRKVLGDGHDEARFITNVPGRGYCFVSPVAASPSSHDEHHCPVPTSHNLPVHLTAMIGRSDAVEQLAALLSERRFVTIAGPGGMGKTTVALAVAEQLFGVFGDGVRFVDLAPIAEESRVANVVATALEISTTPEHALPTLCSFLRDKKVLVVLDNCEQVIGAAATVAESLLKSAARLSILATSREPLLAEGEWVYRLPPLRMPSPSEDLTAARALEFPAIRLFAQRASAAVDGYTLSDTDAPLLGRLCRQLDGIPLAIEFAAARVDSLGVRGLAADLSDRLRLLTRGRRTDLPRHRTLKATLDWSFKLLSMQEQIVLSRLAVFVEAFTLDAAQAVASDDRISRGEVAECVMNLVSKSLISSFTGDSVIRYRQLETTRAYAIEQLVAGIDSANASSRHALFFLELLTRAEEDWRSMPRVTWLESYCGSMEDVWTAIGWCFSNDAHAGVGVRLTAAALLPVYELGLLDAHYGRIDQALQRIHLLSPEQPEIEMRLNAALLFPGGRLDYQRQPLADVVARNLALARRLRKPKYHVTALYGLWGKHFREGNYASAITVARKMKARAQDAADPEALLLSQRLLAQSGHFMGDHIEALGHARSVLLDPPRRLPLEYVSPVPHSVAMRIVLARILWLQGNADQALAMADECMQHAAANPFAFTQSLALAACPIALWRGDETRARELVDKLIEHSARHPSAYWQSWGHCYHAVLSFQKVEATSAHPQSSGLLPETSNVMVQDCIATLFEERTGEVVLRRVLEGRVGWCAAEVLRRHGESILKHGTEAAVSEAESFFTRSLEISCKQGALAWELRAAMSLGRLWRSSGRVTAAAQLIRAPFQRFTEGLEDVDLRTARVLLEEMA